MARYRVYAVQFDGNFDGYETLNCNDDVEAIGEAQRLANNKTLLRFAICRTFRCPIGRPGKASG